MNQIILFLQSIHPLSPKLVEHLLKVIKSKTFLKKDFILKAGHVSRCAYFISQGLLRAFYIKNDKDISSWFMKEGDFSLSIESFYDQKQSYENIQALEDCNIYSIDYYDLEHIYQQFPEFNYIGRVLTIKYHKLWAQQLYSLRMQTAQERYQWLLTNHPDLLLRVPAKYIASYLDITEVTLSKIKGKKFAALY